jgi:SAM-dependent methyltransferase
MLPFLPRIRFFFKSGLPSRSHPAVHIDAQGCAHCGHMTFEQQAILPEDLVATWEMNPDEHRWLDEREGHFCTACGMSRRVRMLYWTIQESLASLQGLHILNINAINNLEQSLTEAREVVTTTYLPEYEMGTLLGEHVNQDVEALTFDDASFDLVIHSETVEHVFDYERALGEMHRVLRPGGLQIYTVPLLHARKTRQRMKRGVGGRPVHLLPPSYHGLEGEYPVVWEFGRDFLRRRGPFIQNVYYDDFQSNPTVFAIVERRPQ